MVTISDSGDSARALRLSESVFRWIFKDLLSSKLGGCVRANFEILCLTLLYVQARDPVLKFGRGQDVVGVETLPVSDLRGFDPKHLLKPNSVCDAAVHRFFDQPFVITVFAIKVARSLVFLACFYLNSRCTRCARDRFQP